MDIQWLLLYSNLRYVIDLNLRYDKVIKKFPLNIDENG